MAVNPINPKVKKIYDTLKNGGGDVGTEQEFNDWFFAKGEQGYKNRKSVYETLKGGGADAGANYEEFRDWLGLHAVGKAAPVVHPALQKTSGKPSQPTSATMTDAQKQQMVQGVSGLLDKTQQGMRQTANRMKYAKGNTGLSVKPVKLGQNKKVVERAVFNPASGKMEKRYLTESGNEYDVRAFADSEQRHTDFMNRSVDEELQEAYSERDRLLAEIEELGNYYERGNPVAVPGSVSVRALRTRNDSDIAALQTAYNKTLERITTLEAERDDNGGTQFWRGFTDASTADTWLMGLPSLQDNGQLLRAKRKLERGEELTRSERAMLDATVMAADASARYGKNRGKMYEYGQMAMHSLPFMLQFIGTGGGLGLAMKAGKSAGDVAAGLTANALGKWMLKQTGRALGSVGGAVAEGALMANTIGAAGTAGDIIRRYVGDATVDENGAYIFEGGKSLPRSVYEGEVASSLEYGSEVLGGPIDKVLGKAAGRMGLSKLTGLYERVSSNTVGRAALKVLEKMQVHSLPGEILEEEAGMFGKAALGVDNNFSIDPKSKDFKQSLFNLENHLDVVFGIGLSMGLTGAAVTTGVGGVYGIGKVSDMVAYRRTKHAVDKADALASFRLTKDRWEELREKIDGTPNTDFKELGVQIATDESLDTEEKKAALEYMGQLVRLRGFNLGMESKARQNVQDKAAGNPSGVKDNAEEDAANAKYSAGYDANLDARMDIATGLRLSPDDTMSQAAWDGVMQRIEDDADIMAAVERERTEQMQHTDGSLRPATLKEKDSEGNDQQVYIVDGNVQMMPDGSMVDKASSDNIVVVRNPVTGERKQIDPSADTGISSLGEVTTAEQLEADIERSRQEYVQAQIDEAQGTVRFVPGQQLVLPTGEEAVVVATDADGENITVALGDGTQTTVQRSELQRIRDEKAAADYRQRHGSLTPDPSPKGEGSEMPQAGAGGVVAGAPADYTADMKLTIRDEDGSEKPAMVMGMFRAVSKGNGIGHVPDANGNLVGYLMDGEPHFEHKSKISDKVVSHTEERAVPKEMPQYSLNDDVYLQTEDGEVHGNVIAEENPDGLITIQSEQPIGGRIVNQFTREQLDGMTGNNAVENIPPQVNIGGENIPQEPVEAIVTPADAPAQPTEQPTAEPMPMVDVKGKMKPDWSKATPARAHAYLYNERGLSRENANAFVENNRKAAASELEKLRKKKPEMGTDLDEFEEKTAEWQGKTDEAQRVLDYWQQVRNIQNDIQRVENERRAAEDAVRHDEAVAEAQAEYEARKQAEAERKAVGNENPMPAITEKWNNATKVDGHRDEIMLPDGTPLKGHYVLHESGASSPSHNPETWQKTDGFPMDANDNSVNDRDYERDHDAQEHTQSIARQYDQRALQSVPVVSNDGVVLSGNGRTMAGELAARDNTDGAYVNYLKEYAPKFGFTAEQVGAMQHPRVSFVPDEAMPYTAETFAKFNQQEMKSQNKTEQAVKLGKTVSDDSFKGIVRTINGYDTLGNFYNDAQASLGAIYDLHSAGVVPQAQLAEMVDGVRGQEKLSAVGREFLENILIGKAFESDPEVVRMLTAEPAMRQTVITALGEIVDNIALGGDWSLQGELADAVKLCFDARQGGAKYGEIVSTYARQGVLFADPDELQTVADFNNATMLMLADVLNDKRVTLLKTTLQLYNNNARQSAAGQTDLFAGDIQSREDILRDVITFINENYGKRKEIEAARAEAVERRKAESVQQNGTPPAVGTDGEATAEPSAEPAPVEAEPVEATEPVEAEPNAVQTALAAAEQETNTEPTEAQKEAGNYKKGHVKIDGYDVTIENPKGSVRSGVNGQTGHRWATTMQNTYGYIRGTKGVDGDHIDVFFSEDPSQGDVFVVDQVNKDGSFDEHKVMYGFPDIESARKAYLSNYEDGWQGLGAITPVSKDEFKKWIDSSHRKTKPFAEYSSVKPLGDTQLGEQPNKPTVKAGEDYVSAAERIARENEVKRTAAHFAEETQEEAAAFDKRVPEMDDAELLTYMQEDGKGDVNKAHHPSVYDEYDYRHGDEQLQSYDDTLVRLNESGTTLEQAEEMLANIQKDVSRLATEDRAMLLGQEDALQEYIDGLEKVHFDRQGNPVDADGNLILEEISSVDELKGKDFSSPTRNVQLPKIPDAVDKAIGANGKPVIIKKNIFEKNARDHKDLKPSQSREILKTALYTPDLYGQNQKVSRPYNYVVISTKGADGRNRLVLLEVNNGKENVEIVHWHYIRDNALETLKRQTEREGGHILILPSDKSEEAGGLSSRTLDLSSAVKGTDLFGNAQGSGKKSSSDGKIDDVGEVLAGARKDMRKEIAKSLANVTEAALVEKPFGKVYKKPDLKKAVESGALREKDAIFYEALFSMVNQQKPKVTQSEMRSKRYIPDHKTKAERWAADTFKQMEVLRQFMELDEPGRDAMMERMLADRYPTREQELAEIEKRKGWNPDYEGHKYEWGEMTTPNPLWVTHEVMNRLGYSVGDKLDVPYGVVKANTSGTGYLIENLKGERASLFGSGMTLDEAIDRIVYLAKLKRGDADVSHPTQLFAFPATKSESGESGRYRVMWGRDYKTREFDSKDEADAFAQTKNGAYVSPIMETKRKFGYKVRFTHPLTGEKMFVDDTEFDTKEEAQAYFDGNFEKLNEATNAKLQEEREKKGEKKTLTVDDVVHVTMVHSEGGWTHAVVIDKKYANNDGQVRIIKEGFASRKDAKSFADSVKDDVLKTVLKHKEDAKKIVYFDTGENSRIGEDYRNGKNVDAEDFMNTFGFRGVQFGNWTNQADRQMAVNQTYDAFMDMARLIGVSPKAMSLNGELGIAFGARGVGGFAAHYEPGEVVINLTKTQGAGSLAHEWWHALDNYFARRAGSVGDMVTDNRRIEMRDALRKAFNDMLDLVNGSDYAQRSAAKGEYWGRTHEITARLLAEWVDRELKKRGELNTFLSRGAVVERGQQHNYDVYEVLERLAGREPMPFEEYKELPESLKGIPYPSAKEVEQFGASLRHIFDTLEEQVDEETGNVALLHKATSGVQPTELTEREVAFRDALVDTMRDAGIEVNVSAEEGQRVLDMVNGEAKLMGSRTNKKMANIGEAFEGRELTEQQQKVVDVFRGKSDNTPIEVERVDGKVRVIMRQGNDEKAGTKHSLYGHYGTNKGVITDEDILIIPDVLARGERTPKMRGNTQLYEYTLNGENGTRYTVLTEKKHSREEFADFYTNKKTSQSARKTRSEEARDIDNNDVSSAKLQQNSDTSKEMSGKIREHRVYHGSGADFDAFDHSHKVKFFRTRDGKAFGYTYNGKMYIDPRIATSETPVHEYAHLWAETLRRSDPQLWEEIKGVLLHDEAVKPFIDKVRKEYPEVKDEDELLDEVLAQYSGKRGAERLRKAAEEIAGENPTLDARALARAAMAKVKSLLEKFWRSVAKVFGWKYSSAAEIADKVLSDLLSGVNPKLETAIRELSLRHNREVYPEQPFDTPNIRNNSETQAQNGENLLLGRDGLDELPKQSTRFYSAKERREREAYAERQWRRAHEVANEIIDKLNISDDITVYESIDEVPGSAKFSAKQRRSKGWYDPRTNKIVVVLGNHRSPNDVKQTILHEAVAHYGLRKLFGKNFETFLDNVYKHADMEVRRRIISMAANKGWDIREATEEYLASLAEDTDFDNAERRSWAAGHWFNKIKQLFLDMLHHIGLRDYDGGSLTDNELRYILWRSYKNLAEPGHYRNYFSIAEDTVMQSNLHVGYFTEETGQTIEQSTKVAESGLMFRDGDFSPRDRSIARDTYERMVSTGGYLFQEAVQDSMLGLKRLYQSILGKGTRIEDVDGFENAYLAENPMSSVNAAEQHEYYVRYMKPLLKAISDIAGANNGKRQELTDYMMAKHGLERNVVMAQRDFDAYQRQYPSGTKTLDDFRERDYAGLTALTGEDDVAMAELAAQQMVDNYEQDNDTTELWKRVNDATAATLAKIYSSGLLSKERYEQIQKMFEYYIPLQGWDETTSDEVYGYLTSKNGPLGSSPIKHAKGRSSKADDPIATIALMADDAIRQGNRNKMKQTFLNFVLNHQSDLVSVNDLWIQYNAAMDEWEPVFADIENSDTAADVERKVEAFEERMQQLAESDPDNYKRGRDAQNIPYKVVKDNLKEHQVLVRRNGRTYVLTINGNPRAAQALNGLTNPDVETGGVVGNLMQGAQWINRNLSAFYTTRNPDFVASNFFRDMLYSNCMTWVKESPKYAVRFHKNFGRVNPVRMRMLLGKWNDGTLDDGNYIERLFKQFMLNGGETGYTNIKDIDGHKREIVAELKRNGSNARKAWQWLGEQLDLLNGSVENCARFAAFVTSREEGRSIERSIFDAKEISVNFNKKGSGGKMLGTKGQERPYLTLLLNPKTYFNKTDRTELIAQTGSYVGGGGRLLYVFWNAGVQGTTNFARAAKRNPIKATLGAASMFMLGAVIPLLAQAMGGGDDDDKNAYYNLPEYVRRSNIIINAGNKWIAIPLPIEFRAFYGLGELATGVITGNERYSDSELAFQMGSQISQILPLDMLEGGGGINPFIPSIAKPFVEAYFMNKSWTGLPVYKDSPWNKNNPEWTKAYKSANTYLVSGAKWLNDISGGDDYKKGFIDINPAKVEYLLSGMFGGAFTTVNKLVKMGETIFSDREFDWRNILIANRVVKTGDERTANRKLSNEYFKYKDEYEETKRLLKKYSDEAATNERYKHRLERLQNSEDYLLYDVFDNYQPILKNLHDAKDGADETTLKSIESEENTLRRDMVDLMHAIEDDKNPDINAHVDAMLKREFEAGGRTQKPAGSRIAKRLGGTDIYGSPQNEYGQVYLQMRDYIDLVEDVTLQVALKKAKDSGDTDRAKDIESARRQITEVKKDLAEVPYTLSDGTKVTAKDIMLELRDLRKNLLSELGITTQQQPNR